MKLFIAIDFDKTTKEILGRSAEWLETSEENNNWQIEEKEKFHLTLFYLGDTYTQDTLSKTLKKVNFKEFHLCPDDLGIFRKEQFGVIWAGVGGEVALLNELRKKIEEALICDGLSTGDTQFRPHITLAYTDPDSLPSWECLPLPYKTDHTALISGFHLFAIDQQNGKETFPIIESFPFKEQSDKE